MAIGRRLGSAVGGRMKPQSRFARPAKAQRRAARRARKAATQVGPRTSPGVTIDPRSRVQGKRTRRAKGK